LTEPVRIPPQLNLPPALTDLVERCLAKVPGDRPASIDSVKDELTALAHE
jgi:hypothetical protein